MEGGGFVLTFFHPRFFGHCSLFIVVSLAVLAISLWVVACQYNPFVLLLNQYIYVTIQKKEKVVYSTLKVQASCMDSRIHTHIFLLMVFSSFFPISIMMMSYHHHQKQQTKHYPINWGSAKKSSTQTKHEKLQIHKLSQDQQINGAPAILPDFFFHLFILVVTFSYVSVISVLVQQFFRFSYAFHQKTYGSCHRALNILKTVFLWNLSFCESAEFWNY